MRLTMLVVMALSLGTGLAGCKSDDEEGELPDVDCSGTLPTYAQVTAFTKCSVCHSSAFMGAARQEAPADVNFDTEAGALAHAMKAAEEVNEGAMPPAGSGVTLTEMEKQDLYRWTLCTTN